MDRETSNTMVAMMGGLTKSVVKVPLENYAAILPYTHDLAERRNKPIHLLEVHVADTQSSKQENRRTPCVSWISVTYPLASSALLREQYQRFKTTELRFGKLVEDMDALAGDVAVRHMKGGHIPTNEDNNNTYARPGSTPTSTTVVTASVDRIAWVSRPDSGADLRLEGQVSWVGKSSLEVVVAAHQRKMDAWSPLGEARLVFVAMPTASVAEAKAKKIKLELVPQLHPATDNEKRLFRRGNRSHEARTKLRSEERNRRRAAGLSEKSLDAMYALPTPQETGMLHRHLLRWSGEGLRTARTVLSYDRPLIEVSDVPDTAATLVPPIPIERTVVSNSLLMHAQERNANGLMFGGHLMRECIELAWIAAYRHVGAVSEHGGASAATSPLRLAFVDDVSFRRPVPVGSVLDLSATVARVEMGKPGDEDGAALRLWVYVDANVHVGHEHGSRAQDAEGLPTTSMLLQFQVDYEGVGVDENALEACRHVPLVYARSYKAALQQMRSRRHTSKIS